MLIGSSAHLQLFEYIHTVAPEWHFISVNDGSSLNWESKAKITLKGNATQTRFGRIDYVVIGTTADLLCVNETTVLNQVKTLATWLQNDRSILKEHIIFEKYPQWGMGGLTFTCGPPTQDPAVLQAQIDVINQRVDHYNEDLTSAGYQVVPVWDDEDVDGAGPDMDTYNYSTGAYANFPGDNLHPDMPTVVNASEAIVKELEKLSPVRLARMAIYLERAMRGKNYIPSAVTGTFSDVPANHFAADFIEQLSRDGITAGCGNNNYCPDSYVKRDQMAVFLIRAKYGANYAPPVATGVFSDVPTNYWAARWIEKLAADGITDGCGGGKYCPSATIPYEHMKLFLDRTFGQ